MEEREEGELPSEDVKSEEDSPKSPNPKSIVIMQLPTEMFNRDNLLEYFTQFGEIERISCSLKNKYGIIHFKTNEGAKNAKENGKLMDPKYKSANIFYSSKRPAGVFSVTRKSIKGPPKSPLLLGKTRKPSIGDGISIKRTDPFSRVSRPLTTTSSSLREGSAPKKTDVFAERRLTLRPSPSSREVSPKKIDMFAKERTAFPTASVTNTENENPFTSFRIRGVPFSKPIENGQVPGTRAIKMSDKVIKEENKSESSSATYDLLTFKPDTSEAQELFSKRFSTAEERYRALEARDKLLRARIPKVKVRVELATKLFGTCTDMCPEKERYMRQYQRQLTVFEVLNSQDALVDDRKAIKAYSRSSADQEEPLPHDLRPGKTLDMTMDYLLHNIVPISEKEEDILADWYNFLWDRTRSIRKDITQQQLTDLQAVGLMEKCARFHIHCSSRLCELDLHSFEPKLNDENLMKCLQSLEHLYDDLRRRGIKCPNEPEFRAYQIMMNLNEGDILSDVQQRPEWVLKSPEVLLALKIHHIVFNKNFVAFFRVIKNSSYMVSCILHRYFFQVRSAALRSLWKSHSCPPKIEVQVSFSAVQRMLGYGNSVAGFRHLCESHGITCDIINDRLLMNRKMFSMPESRIISRENSLIESKLSTSVAEAINGQPLGPNPSSSYIPHSSFDEEGYLIPGSVAGNNASTSSADTVDYLMVQPQQQQQEIVSFKIEPTGEGQSSFGSVANQKSLISGFFKTKRGIGRSISPTPPTTSGFQFSMSQAPPLQQRSIFGTVANIQERESSYLQVPALLPPPYEDPRFKQEQALDAACYKESEKYLDRMLNTQVIEASEAAMKLAEEQRRQRLLDEQKELIRNKLLIQAAEKYAAKIAHIATVQLAKEEILKHKVIQRLCEIHAEEVRIATVDHMLPSIVKEIIDQKKREQARIVEKVDRIFVCVKTRKFLYQWKAAVIAKKLEKKRREEKVERDRLEFPAANAIYKSKLDMLIAFRGNGKTRSPNMIKFGRTTTQLLDWYEKAEAVTQNFQQKLQDVTTRMNQSFSENANNSSMTEFNPVPRKLDMNLCDHAYKRRWSDGVVHNKDFLQEESTFKRPLKKCRREPNLSFNDRMEAINNKSFGTLVPVEVEIEERVKELPKSQEESLLDEIKRFMEETRSEKSKVLTVTPVADHEVFNNTDF